ncbi:MAG: hypothetical protein E7526_01550 [Ruminococcaceae bacterium]|nr:hypothetical protein [Oscillospiraceae bacterium]
MSDSLIRSRFKQRIPDFICRYSPSTIISILRQHINAAVSRIKTAPTAAFAESPPPKIKTINKKTGLA